MKRALLALLFVLFAYPTWAALTCPTTSTGASVTATSCWRLQEASATAITNTIDSNSGTISGSSTLNLGGGIACNDVSASGCNITTPTSHRHPQPMSIVFSFSGTGGPLFQSGSTSVLTATTSYYTRYLNNNNLGRLTFGANNNDGTVNVLSSQLSYADSNPHIAMATIRNFGMKLSVDGALIARRSAQLAGYAVGYWFFGGMNTPNWPLLTSLMNFNGTLLNTAWWDGKQLSDAQAETIAFGTPPTPTGQCSGDTNSGCTQVEGMLSNPLPALIPTPATRAAGVFPSWTRSGLTRVNNLSVAYVNSGSQATTTGTISPGSNQITVGSATGWQPGMWANIPGAGTASTMSGTSTASATVGNCASGCIGSYGYVCVPIDIYGGTIGKSSTSPILSSQNMTLSSTNYNDIQCAGISSAGTPSSTTWATYAVYRISGGAAQGLIGYSSASAYAGSPYFKDTGLSVLPSTIDGLPISSPPSSPISDRLVTEITGITGTTFTVSPTATTAVSGATILHDDTAAIQNALSACNTNSARVVWLSPNGLSNITNSGNPLLSSMAYKNLALIMYPNCEIAGYGWGTGLNAQSASVSLYPINGTQYTGSIATATSGVVLTDFAINGNKGSIPLDDYYQGSGGAETVEVGLYVDDMISANFDKLYIFNTATDGAYLVNGSSDWSLHDGRISSSGHLSDQTLTYRNVVVGVGPTNWKVQNEISDSASGFGIAVQSESPGAQTQEGLITGNTIRQNGNYGIFLGDSACGNVTQTLSNLTVTGNAIYNNVGGIAIQGIGNGACTETTKQILIGKNDIYNNGVATTPILLESSKNAGTSGIVQDIQILDNYIHNDSSIAVAGITLSASGANTVLRTIVNGNIFGNFSTAGLVAETGSANSTNTVLECNYTQVASSLPRAALRSRRALTPNQ